MKKMVFILFFLLTALFIYSDSGFSAGAGVSHIPGINDPTLITMKDKADNGEIQGFSPDSTKIDFNGLYVFGQFTWNWIMLRASFQTSFPSAAGYSYTETISETVTVKTYEHKQLLILGTLWIGPAIKVSDKGFIYACIGPSFMYGEYRDKITENDNSIRDRQYTGYGFIIPVLIGVEGKISSLISLAVETIFLSQQIILETNSPPNNTDPASDPVHTSMLFPGLSFLSMPYQLQLSLIFHF